ELPRAAHRLRARPHRRALSLHRPGTHRAAHRVFARRGKIGGPLHSAAAPRIPGRVLRRGLRLGDVHAGDGTRGARGARLYDRPSDKGSRQEVEAAPYLMVTAPAGPTFTTE